MKKSLIVFTIFFIFSLLVSCSPQNQIEGKWYDEYGIEIEFYNDGTFVISNLGFSLTGDYRFIDDETLLLESDGIIGLFGAQVFTVEISNQELVLRANNDEIRLYREQPTLSMEDSPDNRFADKEVELASTPEEAPWYQTINPILIYYQDPLSSEEAKKFKIVHEPFDGMRRIAFQVAFQNLSTSEWLRLDPRFLSVSGDEFEFDRSDFAQPCLSFYSEEDPEKNAFCSYMHNGDIATTLIPPMFQVTTSIFIWEVGEQTQNLTFNVRVSNSEGEQHIFNISLDQSNVQEFRTQFVGNLSWDAYQRQPLENVQLMNFGETLEFDFGLYQPIDYFIEDSDYDSDWLLRSEITNSSAGYPMNLDISDAFFIDAQNFTWSFGGYTNTIGPQLSETITSTFGRDNYYKHYILQSHQHTPQTLAELVKPFCWIITEFDWRTTEGNHETEAQIILCID